MGEELDETVKKAKRGETMPVRFLRRTRHWTDGGIIGSKEFIQKTACYFSILEIRSGLLRKNSAMAKQ